MSESSKKPKIGVVIGAGGIKPVGAIALFEFFEQQNLPIDLLVGCSGGSIISGAKGIGFTTSELHEMSSKLWTPALFNKTNYQAIAGMLNLPFSQFNQSMGILSPEAILKTLRDLFQDTRLENLSPKVLIQTTDFNTGEGVVLSSGSCVDAIYASSALVPFLPPHNVDGRILTDGGFSCTLPIIEAVKANMDIIIAMNFDELPSATPTSCLDLCNHFFKKVEQHTTHNQTALAIHMHHYEIILIPVLFETCIQLWESNKIPLIYETAKTAIEAAKPSIFHAIDNFYHHNEKDKRKGT